MQIWQKNNAEKINAYNREYRALHKDKRNARRRATRNNKERYKTDVGYRLKDILRSRLYKAINNNQKTGSAVKDLGCSVAKLKIKLQLAFHRHPVTGEYMTWDNYGRDGWHIDHIVPLASFDLSDRDQFLKACHYTNLQPLWAKENWSKGAKHL
jgi:hypothetical protein